MIIRLYRTYNKPDPGRCQHAPSGTASAAMVEADVEGGDAVGEPADRDEVDAGGGDGGGDLGRDPAGGLGDRAAAHESDRLAQFAGAHIVEQHRVDALGERRLELGERIHLDLDPDEMAGCGAGARDGGRDAAGDSDVVVL